MTEKKKSLYHNTFIFVIDSKLQLENKSSLEKTPPPLSFPSKNVEMEYFDLLIILLPNFFPPKQKVVKINMPQRAVLVRQNGIF